MLQWAVAIWLGGLALGITGLAIWVSLRSAPDKNTTVQGLVLYHLGQALILLCAVAIAVGFATVVARGVWIGLGGR